MAAGNLMSAHYLFTNPSRSAPRMPCVFLGSGFEFACAGSLQRAGLLLLSSPVSLLKKTCWQDVPSREGSRIWPVRVSANRSAGQSSVDSRGTTADDPGSGTQPVKMPND